jgi:hypothetical protein
MIALQSCMLLMVAMVEVAMLLGNRARCVGGGNWMSVASTKCILAGSYTASTLIPESIITIVGPYCQI